MAFLFIYIYLQNVELQKMPANHYNSMSSVSLMKNLQEFEKLPNFFGKVYREKNEV